MPPQIKDPAQHVTQCAHIRTIVHDAAAVVNLRPMTWKPIEPLTVALCDDCVAELMGELDFYQEPKP